MTTRLMLVDDHPVYRSGLRALIDAESDMVVVGEADDGNAALALARDVQPTLAVMDVSMPGLNGVEATRRLIGELPDLRVLSLSLHADRHIVAEMLQAGASGYALKNAAGSDLIDAIRTVARNDTYLAPSLVGGVVADYVRQLAESGAQRGPHLTGREVEILQLIADGVCTGGIAERLSISPKTVGSHRTHIMEKLDLHSVAALTKYAIRRGITTKERLENA